MVSGTTYLAQFDGDILVRCPSCDRCGHLLRQMEPQAESAVSGYYVHLSGYRFVCCGCGANRDWTIGGNGSICLPSAGPQLHGFDLSLWLQGECCGEVLWAYNIKHIEFLESFIGAKVRGGSALAPDGVLNSSLESRLPRWMTSAKNREQVLRGLQSLRELAPR